MFVTRYVFRVKSCQHLTQPPSWRINLYQLSVTAYSIYRVCINYQWISLRHNLSSKCCNIVKFVLITHSECNIWNGHILPSHRKSVNQCWREMAASPTEHSWCVLEFVRCFVAVQCAFRRQFGHRAPPETSIRRWYEQFCYRGCICHQGKGHMGRPSVTEETADRVRETFTCSARKSVRRASRELKIPEPTVKNILWKRLQLYPYKMQLVQNTPIIYTHSVL
jgi:hypothetical protein